MSLRLSLAAALLSLSAAPLASAGETVPDTFTWLSTSTDVLGEGILWNDRFGDGRDRYKTGGITQSWVLPQSIFSDKPWFADRAGALEVQVRGLTVTPDNTAAFTPGDRPYAQYLGGGLYLRTFGRDEQLTRLATVATEDRVGIELGFLGAPLPLFEIQEAIHGATGMAAMARSDANSLNGGFLANVEAKRTWRVRARSGEHEIELAPFVQASAGMRENSVRAGVDLIHGSSLAARTWNHDPAIGALIPGGSAPRDGAHWIGWIGADAGYVATDALIDGGPNAGLGVDPEPLSLRLRAGVMAEWENFALTYSVAWLAPEFDGQREGQLVGAVQVKFRF